MRKKGSWSDTTYETRVSEVELIGKGSATFLGEERARQGKGLDPLVDPSKYDVVRGSNNLLIPDGKEFVLEFGVAMPVETDFDTTGSMGGNVDIAFQVLPKVQSLLVQGPNAILKRYHTQIATGIIQDRVDTYPYLRSMFEPDNEVERQMGLLVPQRSGGDATEDYQLGLFAAAYLTKTSINQYGLKGYYFVVGDERGRDELDVRVLEQVFGTSVLEKAFGSNRTEQLPSTEQVAAKLLESWHGFFLQVGENSETKRWWTNLFGETRLIALPRTQDIAEVQAAIIGLTEGVFDDKASVVRFLEDSGVSREVATKIFDAVRLVPFGLQASYTNFSKIPLAGARFKSREDIWPVGKKSKPSAKPVGKPSVKPKKDKDDWKL